MVDNAFNEALKRDRKKVRSRDRSLMPNSSQDLDNKRRNEPISTNNTALGEPTQHSEPIQVIARLAPELDTQLKTLAIQWRVSRDAVVEALIRYGLDGDMGTIEASAKTIHRRRVQAKELKKAQTIAAKLKTNDN